MQVGADAKVRLSGYGVELAIKSTEYKAKDDAVITGTYVLCVVQSFMQLILLPSTKTFVAVFSVHGPFCC